MIPRYLNGDYSPNGMIFFLIFPKLGSRTGKLDDKMINLMSRQLQPVQKFNNFELDKVVMTEVAVIKMKRLDDEDDEDDEEEDDEEEDEEDDEEHEEEGRFLCKSKSVES